jgi:hypothetical protein
MVQSNLYPEFILCRRYQHSPFLVLGIQLTHHVIVILNKIFRIPTSLGKPLLSVRHFPTVTNLQVDWTLPFTITGDYPKFHTPF